MAEMKENAEKLNFNAEETDFEETSKECEAEEEMKSSAKNVKLTPYDELFFSSTTEIVQKIEINRLLRFNKHPFRIKEDEEMEKLIQSISEKGILTPAIARPTENGYYELISGHRRRFACMKLGIETMPVIVRRLDDDEAIIEMVDANLQREHILPSERAFSYKMKLEALKHQGKRTDLTPMQVAEKLSVEKVGESEGISKDQVRRFIRLTKLTPELLQMVDDNKLKFNTGVELSYLEPEEQKKLHEFMEKLNMIPSLEQSKKLKKYSQEQKINDSVIEVILTEEAEKSTNNITLKKKDLKQYFPKSYSKKEMENVIFELLKQWQKQQEYNHAEE